MDSGEKCMKHMREKDRKELEAKLANAFQENIDQLPTELREILLDDMVTAFENRLNVLNRASGKAEN
jgi:HD-GYP domain-containing protein (c-di-GMP phosphodiesterase class II)